MKLLFQQRFFSWFDSYDIYNEKRETVYTVSSMLHWGHKLKILDPAGNELGIVKEEVFAWPRQYQIYIGGQYIGRISKRLAFLKQKFNIDFNGWQVHGDGIGWDYSILDANGMGIATISREIPNWTDTYSAEIYDPQNVLYVVMLMVAIDAEKCSRKR